MSVVNDPTMNHSSMVDQDDMDRWSSGSASSGSSESESNGFNNGKDFNNNDYRLYEDYFGLNNLLRNINISEDNSLLFQVQKNAFQRGNVLPVRRVSVESDSGDSGIVLSSVVDGLPYPFDPMYDPNNNININISNNMIKINNNLNVGNVKNGERDASHPNKLPPPSMRLSKTQRDDIISGAYQQRMDRACRTCLPGSKDLGVQQQQQQQPEMSNKFNNQFVCVFCRNNGENESVYTSHVLKDSEGHTSCPILRAYTCPICKANGDNSHTIKYCPMNQNTRGPATMGGNMMMNGSHPEQQGVNMANIGPRGYQPRQRPVNSNYRPPFNAPISPAGVVPPQHIVNQPMAARIR